MKRKNPGFLVCPKSLGALAGALVLFALAALSGAAVPASAVAQPQDGTAGTDSGDSYCLVAAAIDNAYFANDQSGLAELANPTGNPDNFWTSYLMAFAHYRLAILSRDDRSQTKTHANEAISILERLVKDGGGAGQGKEEQAEALALLSAVYGLRINGIFSGIRFGPKSSKAIEETLVMTPQNPRVLLLDGVRLFNTPGSFGGDKDRARERFLEALAAIENDTATPCWGKADAHYWLARINLGQKNYETAAHHLDALENLHPESPFAEHLRNRIQER